MNKIPYIDLTGKTEAEVQEALDGISTFPVRVSWRGLLMKFERPSDAFWFMTGVDRGRDYQDDLHHGKGP